MTSDEIIRMAREAGLAQVVKQHDDGTVTLEVPNMPKLERFAELVAAAAFSPDELQRFAERVGAAERERCAKVCEETTIAWTEQAYNNGCTDCAQRIRSLRT